MIKLGHCGRGFLAESAELTDAANVLDLSLFSVDGYGSRSAGRP